MERTSFATPGNPPIRKEVTKKEIKEYFNERYSYGAFNEEFEKYLHQPHMLGKSIEDVANLLYDKLLSEGDAEVQE